ncbi:hypothetical protein LIER_20182 [Lithospermum erythrorhizon]|uniref:Reverse transcriptase RNase H-like domain-containing protein n=1 Tax=Lithospermum erythrorhizon TaxID=34254 RepID=A0AAV3QNL6_LITER
MSKNTHLEHLRERGIEPNIDKIKTLLDMKPPGSYKDVQKLTGESCFHGPEENYPMIDKFAFAVLITARKLNIYFEAHPIKVITDQPLKRVLASPALSRRLTTWAIELSEFEISYEPRANIKTQALADFIVECTARPPQRVNRPEESRPSQYRNGPYMWMKPKTPRDWG